MVKLPEYGHLPLNVLCSGTFPATSTPLPDEFCGEGLPGLPMYHSAHNSEMATGERRPNASGELEPATEMSLQRSLTTAPASSQVNPKKREGKE
ncbi:hypothetical protein PoB_006351900 [Plakobranchus ocellatus]|uniref:Uncharacterized protein n=1 Tax=Plakobranchus ocellatus TaxID=259542 RepID=A0AAV4CYJ8_9GAST|nr:hypothetical protein PoB_006351900 [Plakobranchus ocellatus]